MNSIQGRADSMNSAMSSRWKRRASAGGRDSLGGRLVRAGAGGQQHARQRRRAPDCRGVQRRVARAPDRTVDVDAMARTPAPGRPSAHDAGAAKARCRGRACPCQGQAGRAPSNPEAMEPVPSYTYCHLSIRTPLVDPGEGLSRDCCKFIVVFLGWPCHDRYPS